MSSPFKEPDGRQAKSPTKAAWELFSDLRHKEAFSRMTSSQWTNVAASTAIDKIMHGWHISQLYAAITSQLPVEDIERPALFAVHRMRELPVEPEVPYEEPEEVEWY